MYTNVSSALASKIMENSRICAARLEFDAATLESGFKSITLKQQANSGTSTLEIGGCVAAQVEVEMEKPDNTVTAHEFALSFGMQLDDGSVEQVPMGVFTAQKPTETYDGIIRFTAYDRMYYKLKYGYYTKLTSFPVDGKVILQEIADMAGVTLGNLNALPDGVMIDWRTESAEADDGSQTTEKVAPFSGYTYQEAVGYLAQAYGCFATFNRDGELELRWYEDAGYVVGTSRLGTDAECAECEYELQTIECTVGDDTLSVGDGTVGIAIDSPIMTQELLNNVWKLIGGMTYLPTTASFLGDPRLDLGDIISITRMDGTTVDVPLMSITQSFDGGLSTEVGSYGDTEETEAAGSGGSVSAALSRLSAELLLAEEAILSKVSTKYLEANYANITTLESDYVKTDYLTANYINATDIAAKYVATEYLTTNYLTAASIEAKYATIETLEAKYATIEMLEADYVKADYLTANYINATDIAAKYVTTTYLTANYITAKEIEAAYTQTTVLESTYATITDLKTVTTTTETLTANVATIRNLLAGETVTGELAAIHLTSDTVVIDDALITDAMINSVSASKLTAGTIYTSLITIQTAEEDRSLYITDSLIAMYDANDTQRLQAGMSSETEGYNFVIWDADGTELFNATGVTASGIPSQTIVNDHVANNAAISGTKLDIESVVSELNKDGSLTVNYANVKINDTTLQYILGEITESTEGDLLGRTSMLETAVETVQGQISSKIWSTDITSAVTEAVDGTVTSAVAYYAVSKSSTYYPTHDDTTAAIVGSMIVGTAVVGNGGSAAWVTEMPEASDDEYVWQSFLITYASGETEWTEPGLLSDAVARGQTTAIAEQYSEVVQTLSKYEVQIGSLQAVVNANYTYLSSQTAELRVSLDEISLSLSKTTETVGTLQSEAVTGSVTEYYKSTSSTECTGGEWTTETVEWEEGTYIWMRTTVTNGVGDEAVSVTTDPVCITGNTGAAGATGADGEDGEDAVNLIIQSSNGTVFKNAAIATTLSVTIIYGDIIISSARELAAVWADAALVWQRKMDGEEEFTDLSTDDSRLSDSGFLLTLTASDVSTRAVFACTLNI